MADSAQASRFAIGKPERWTLFLIAAVAASLRLVQLGAYPEIQADEGLWTNSTKNFLEFGDWFMDRATHLFLSPVFHGLSLITFWLFGPSIWAARLIAAASGSLSVVLLYLLIRRVFGRRDLALTTAALFGLNEWLVIQSRYALIEPTELLFVLSAFVLLTYSSRIAVAAAGFFMGLAILTKINVLFLFPIAAFIPPADRQIETVGAAVRRFAGFAAVAFGIAGAGYAYLYFNYPTQFIAAFTYELDGVHFESTSHPLVRVGRFGIDPEQISRTVLGLFRESPFLFVLATIGVTMTPLVDMRKASGFLLWAGLGTAFFLGQMFQPTRYFYLVTPAYCVLAAVAICELHARQSAASATLRPMAVPLLAVYILFNVGRVAMPIAASRGVKLQTVTEWAETHTQRNDVVLAAGYLCTDLTNRAYAHYRYVHNPREFEDSIRQLHVSYVVFDHDEWRPELGRYLKEHYPSLADWEFGSVYDVRDALATRPVAAE
jgi:4-amino-4-deoxy-L-arabinose transferase-like glycosyltransferase